jgi:hypothetical protein
MKKSITDKRKNNILHGVKKILAQRRRDRKGTQSLSENFFQKVFILNVSAASVWLHVCYTFNNSLRSPRLCVDKNISSFFWLCPFLWGLVQVRIFV